MSQPMVEAGAEAPRPSQSADEQRRARTEQARVAYAAARERVRFSRSPQGGTPNHYPYLVEDVTAAAVELMLSGLDEYLAATAKGQRSMGRLTFVIAAATVVSAIATGIGAYDTLHAARNPPPAPVVNIVAPSAPPPIAIPAPVVNVTVPGAPPKR